MFDAIELLKELRDEWGLLDLSCQCGDDVPQFGDTSCPVCKMDVLFGIYEKAFEQ